MQHALKYHNTHVRDLNVHNRMSLCAFVHVVKCVRVRARTTRYGTGAALSGAWADPSD